MCQFRQPWTPHLDLPRPMIFTSRFKLVHLNPFAQPLIYPIGVQEAHLNSRSFVTRRRCNDAGRDSTTRSPTVNLPFLEKSSLNTREQSTYCTSTTQSFIDLLTLDSTSFPTKRRSADTSSLSFPPTPQLLRSPSVQAPLSHRLRTLSRKTPSSRTSYKPSLLNMHPMTLRSSLKPRLWRHLEAAASG